MSRIFSKFLWSLLITSALRSQVSYNDLFDQELINSNLISLSIGNTGGLISSLTNSSFWLINGERESFVYDQGFLIIGKYNNSLAYGLNQWSSAFSPGPVIELKPAIQVTKLSDSALYRIYKITSESKSSDRDVVEWPAKLGAPINEAGNPILYGTQSLWNVYNLADPNSPLRHYSYSDGICPIEVHQLTYATDNKNPNYPLSNSVFFEYTIINKGINTYDSVFVGIWTDLDFFDAFRNFPAVDTINNLGYCYSGVDSSLDRKSFPAAVGNVLLYGPSVPCPNDSAYFKGSRKVNSKNLGLYSFRGLSSGDNKLLSQPGAAEDLWNFALGNDSKGKPLIDYTTGKSTRYSFSGNPATDEGWIYPYYHIDGEGGFIMFSGPFNLAPNDTQWCMFSLIAAIGDDRFDSIKKLRTDAHNLRSLPYNQLVGNTIIENKIEFPEFYDLSQNYPNPFNSKTKINFEIPVNGVVLIKLYDVLGNEVETIVNREFNKGKYQLEVDGKRLASGIYFYRMQSGGFLSTKKVVLLK